MKSCFKCGEKKPLAEFYKHPMMSDGRLGKCKECTKKDVRANYYARHEQYLAYERKRRPKTRVEYETSWAERNPHKVKATRAVAYAVRTKKLVRMPCVKCGARAHAHHDDYSRPLDVLWLCPKHHKERHKLLGPF